MYQPMLFVHWKQVKLLLIPCVVAAFALPLLSIQGMGTPTGAEAASPEVFQIVAATEVWLPLFPALAGVIGIVLALTAWSWDHRLGHVYALSLPVARWEYALLKMGAGTVLCLLPAISLWFGAHAAAAAVTLPEGLSAYPNHLALRFFVATLLSYAFLFALASGTMKTTVWIACAVFGAFVASEVLAGAVTYYVPSLDHVSGLSVVTDWLVRTGGPFEVFTGNWSLIDV